MTQQTTEAFDWKLMGFIYRGRIHFSHSKSMVWYLFVLVICIIHVNFISDMLCLWNSVFQHFTFMWTELFWGKIFQWLISMTLHIICTRMFSSGIHFDGLVLKCNLNTYISYSNIAFIWLQCMEPIFIFQVSTIIYHSSGNTSQLMSILWDLYGMTLMCIFIGLVYWGLPKALFASVMIGTLWHLYAHGSLLLTWFNFNPSMENYIHYKVWNG